MTNYEPLSVFAIFPLALLYYTGPNSEEKGSATERNEKGSKTCKYTSHFCGQSYTM